MTGVRFELIVRTGANEGQVIALAEGRTITLGRTKACDICVDELSVSRRHCTLQTREDGCEVVDLQSANGTFVNDGRVTSALLKPGDRLRLGSIVLEVGVPGRHVARTTAPAATPPSIGMAEPPPDSVNVTPDERGTTLIRKAIDPHNPDFLTHVFKADTVVAGIESAQRYLSTLHKVSDALSRAASVDELFQAVLSAVLDVIKGDRAAILLRDTQTTAGGTPVVKVAAVHARHAAASARAMTLSRTIVRDVLERGMSAFTHDALADERYHSGDSVVLQQIRSVLCAPMRTNDAILGVVYVDSQSAHEFNESELELLAAIGNQAGMAVHRARLIEDMERLSVDVVRCIAATIDAKDGYTHRHSERVAAFAVLLARQLGLSSRERHIVELSSLLHDVGKIGIPDAILKKPGKLSSEEYSEVCRHPAQGVAILSTIQNARIADLLPGILCHHERWDGTGYPEGLTGEAIPLLGRIVAVADVFDALTSQRSYRQAVSVADAIELVKSQSGDAFDPRIVAALVALHERGDLGVPTSVA